MNAIKTVLEEGDRIDVNDNPNPGMMKCGRVIRQKLTDESVQRPSPHAL